MSEQLFDALNKKTIEYVNLLKKEQVYVDYLNYKSLLEKRPDLMDQINVFRRESFEIQVGHKYGYFNAYENLSRLNEEHEELLNEPIVKQFLTAELKLSKLINHIYTTFAEALDFDMGFLED